jgi:hypothetical protein
MVEGAKRVAHVPTETVDAVRRRVEDGNTFKRGVAECLAINAQLMVLDRQTRARPVRRAARAPRGAR